MLKNRVLDEWLSFLIWKQGWNCLSSLAALRWKMCESFAIAFQCLSCLPSTNLFDVVLRCCSKQFWGHVLQFKGNVWLQLINLQDQNVPWLLPAPCHSPFTSSHMRKLCLFTFKCWMLWWFTLPLAYTLDLAALFPAFHLEMLFWLSPGLIQLLSVLILNPRYFKCILMFHVTTFNLNKFIFDQLIKSNR